MLIEQLTALPSWLLLGIGLGVVASALVAAVFYFGERLFPAAEPSGRYRRVDGSLRRHAEIRSYLQAIGESFVENAAVAGQTTAFYLPERDVAITFDPRVFFSLESSPTYVVLCEDEMPAGQLGRRLPFEVEEPEPRSTSTQVDGSVAGAFDHLGVERGASQDEIRDAYRAQVKEVHPDRGGTEAEFKKLTDAYTTAKEYAK